MMNVEQVKEKGIVGAGGAGFPTHVKLQSRPEIVILNAAECEPLLHKDEQILLKFTRQVIDGFLSILKVTGAKKGIIGIKEKHRDVIEALEREIQPPISIVKIGDFYPAGDEVTLVYLTTGRVIQPGKLPISEGCLVQNVETVFNIASENPVVDKFFTVAGAVSEPATVRVPIGASYADILAYFKIEAPQYIIRSGGLMMGDVIQDPNTPITKTTGGVIILPADHYCAQVYERYSEPSQTIRIAKASCDQCSFCTDLCPRYLLGHPVRPETAMRNIMFSREDMKLVHNGNSFCCECNLCTFYSCPEGLDPRGATIIEKKIALNSGNQWEGRQVKPHPLFDFRKVPTKKLMQRLDVLKFKDEAPLADLQIQPKRVRLLLKQHIGAPAIPVVNVGDTVKKFDLVAEGKENISAHIHASIDGKITHIDSNEIVIERNA